MNFITKHKQAAAIVALGLLLVTLAVVAEPGIVVYDLPREQAAWEASQLAKNFRNAILIVGVVISFTALWSARKHATLYSGVKFEFKLLNHTNGETQFVTLGFREARPASREAWLVEFSKRAVSQATRYWPDTDLGNVQVHLVQAEYFK